MDMEKACRAIRIAVHGASGRMGQLAVAALSHDPRFELVAQWGRQDDLEVALRSLRPEVVLDVTTASAARRHAELIIRGGSRPVIGTSGLMHSDLDALSELVEAHGTGGLVVPNFSVSAALMLRFAELAARYLPHAEIIELHHGGKVDSPSGTALATADAIADARAGLEPRATREQHDALGARGADHRGVHIHSVRLPGLSAHQEVLFGSDAELLTIRSDVFDREAYRAGILLACQRVTELVGLQVGLTDLLERGALTT